MEFSIRNDMFYDNEGRRFYPNGSAVPEKLPSSYQWSGLITSGQRCDTCKLFNNNYCAKWQAVVKPNYWCESWEQK